MAFYHPINRVTAVQWLRLRFEFFVTAETSFLQTERFYLQGDLLDQTFSWAQNLDSARQQFGDTLNFKYEIRVFDTLGNRPIEANYVYRLFTRPPNFKVIYEDIGPTIIVPPDNSFHVVADLTIDLKTGRRVGDTSSGSS